MDRGAQWAAICKAARSRTFLFLSSHLHGVRASLLTGVEGHAGCGLVPRLLVGSGWGPAGNAAFRLLCPPRGRPLLQLQEVCPHVPPPAPASGCFSDSPALEGAGGLAEEGSPEQGMSIQPPALEGLLAG